MTPLVRPDHLVVWLRGLGGQTDPPVVLDEELDAREFDVGEWVARVRDGYPAALACIVHDHSEVTEEWVAELEGFIHDIRFAESRFTGDTLPTEPSRLRRWVRATLAQHAAAADGDAPNVLIEDVVLATNELVSNAGEHAGGWVTVDLVPRRDGVLVAVSDPHAAAPAVFRSVAEDDESGRGLLVVSGLSPIWGVLIAATMKTVWAWLPSRPSGEEPEVAFT